MKHFTLLTAILFCSTLTAGEMPEQPYVTVNGTAEVKVTPNEMNWSLSVKTEDKELPAVAANHTTTVKKVLDFLKSLKIEEDKLQTSNMQFGENWKRINNEHVKIGYYASTNISFTITDFSLYQKLWFGLAGMDGVSINSIGYDNTDRIRYQNESRQKAVIAARDKAAALARTLGSQIGEPLKIQETSNYTPFINSNYAFAEDSSGNGTSQVLALGQISISTTVSVTFKLKNP